ncbi:uncharacterized protein DFL_007971 [Arthrobotrys flagrans]|uniref:Uncharacterized protein n=1 Tax=Arthrobotrys flagrans TaxID=97331 RepID=A0A436ZX71_ARTFL|nr:hypothetical protein DFL_007971 [Arthrobotrys flagrans]
MLSRPTMHSEMPTRPGYECMPRRWVSKEAGASTERHMYNFARYYSFSARVVNSRSRRAWLRSIVRL